MPATGPKTTGIETASAAAPDGAPMLDWSVRRSTETSATGGGGATGAVAACGSATLLRAAAAWNACWKASLVLGAAGCGRYSATAAGWLGGAAARPWALASSVRLPRDDLIRSRSERSCDGMKCL